MGAAWIITTCSSRHADFVRQLGADQVIDTELQWERWWINNETPGTIDFNSF